MSELRLSFPASAIAGKGRITAPDVTLLKTETFPGGLHDEDDAVLLFALNNACRETCPEWDAYFVDALSHFVVHHLAPQGMVDEAKALWLERMLAADGIIVLDIEFQLLMQVLDIASAVPDSLKVFALSQLRHAVHAGGGAYAARRNGPQRRISSADIDFVRSVLADSAAAPAIHRVLLSIDAVSNPALNDAEWIRTLFSMRPDGRVGRGRTGAGSTRLKGAGDGFIAA